MLHASRHAMQLTDNCGLNAMIVVKVPFERLDYEFLAEAFSIVAREK